MEQWHEQDSHYLTESTLFAELQVPSTVCCLTPMVAVSRDCTLKDFRTALAKKGLIDDRLMTESLG